jgi:iron complex outermembrane receptor protein
MPRPILNASVASLLSLALIDLSSVQAQSPATTLLEETVVSAMPLDRPAFEQAQATSTLKGDRLRLALAPTLGETLSSTPGVTSSYFGPASSRPVIRGLDGDRVRILQNGNNTVDASATSADHAVSFSPASLQRIEVVRGPATLLYGPNAVGGVINAVDGRIPDKRIAESVRGSLSGQFGSINTERGGSFTLEGGLKGFAWHLEGYKTATDDLRIPGYARSERLRKIEPLEDGQNEPRNVLPNSNLQVEGLSGGGSYIWESGYFGLAYSGFNTNYGVVAEPSVTIDMEQRRWDFRGAFNAPLPGIRSVRYSLGISDYSHTELEGSEAGTKFDNRGYDGRLEVTHEKIGLLEGVFGYQTQGSDFSALGEEAFLPPTESLMNSAFLFEELAWSAYRLQLGLRYDHASVESSSQPGFGPGQTRQFDNVSGSFGVIYTPVAGYALALNASLTQRAPTYQELFANGPHIATNAFEIGDTALDSEKSLNLDLSLRKKTGFVTGSISVFYNHFSDFIGLFPNGAVVEGEEDSLPVYNYKSIRADFFGGEAEVTFHLLTPATEQPSAQSKDAKNIASPAAPSPTLDLELKADSVYAADTTNSDPLPRIPPFRGTVGLRFGYGKFNAAIEGQYVARQNRTADFELPTDSYFLLNASVQYRLPVAGTEANVYLKGMNLTDAEARVHTSFLKDIAPLGGRGVMCGVQWTF